MKKFAAILLFLILSGSSFAQTGPHKIVFQLSVNDTLAHKALMKQLGNILTVTPDTKIEIVCHGPGLEMLQVGKSIVAEKIAGFAKRGVEFMACEFSMKERKVEKSQIIPTAGFVEAGIIEIVSKQEKGWSYIKAGF
jgi:intracellular sulfur oxidation DsrE/DsrF family protein